MNDISLPYHLLIPTLFSISVLLIIIFYRKRLLNNEKWRSLWISIIVFFSLYSLIVGASIYFDIYAQWNLNKFDLNRDGIFSGKEITSEQIKAMENLTHDTGRNFSFITGLIFSGLISFTFFLVVKAIGFVKRKSKLILISFTLICFALASCKEETKSVKKENISELQPLIESISIKRKHKQLFSEQPEFISIGFDFPVGKPNAKGYYNAQKFRENNHLGDDWNGVGGGNSDLGDAIYAIGNGYVTEVKDYSGGWGNVLRIIHLKNDKLYESLYAHCDTILVSEKQFVKKGDKIATIGNCNGIYLAHLHLEVRDSVNLDIGAGYSSDTTGYLDPTEFIKNNRK